MPRGSSRIYEADVVYEGGAPRLGDRRQVLDSRDLPFRCTLECQNFRPPDERELTFSAYGHNGTEVCGVDLVTGKITNYSEAPDEYDEPEGISPDGRWTLVESDRESRTGLGPGHVDIWKLSLDGRRTWERLTHFNRFAGYKASNPVVSDDGRFMAFQMARSRDPAGVGYGIFLYDLAGAGPRRYPPDSIPTRPGPSPAVQDRGCLMSQGRQRPEPVEAPRRRWPAGEPRTPARSAILSADGRYRYHLSRRLDTGAARIATFIMLNPSTADHLVDDPTFRRCLGFCRRWGCGELHVVNLFALRATDPRNLRRAADPVGPENRAWVRRAAAIGGLVVCGWGTHGSYMGQDLTVLRWIEDCCTPLALGITRGGQPRHPLYVPYAARLEPYRCRQ
jgi:hypothetical protein